VPESTLEAAPATDLARWWSGFGDRTLDTLVARALGESLDLRAAVLRSQEADAQLAIGTAARWPQLSANAAASRNRISESTPQGSQLTSAGKIAIPGIGSVHIPNPYDQFQLGVSASWEVDLFGRLRRSIETANATLEASVEDARGVQVSLVAQVAQAYLALRGAQARRAVALDTLATLGELVQLAQQRRAAGLTSELDVDDALAQQSRTRADLPALDLAISASVHRLGVLLGEQPEALRATLASAAALPPLPPHVPVGLPAELARRRPDIRAAEARLHAASAQIGVAIADLFPHLTLSGSGGSQSESPAGLATWASLFGSIGPTLELPVLDRGRWRLVTLRRLQAQEAALAYRSTVLRAIGEVEDSLAAYQADQRQREWLATTVGQNRQALQIARQRYEGGVADFLNVLDAERTLQQNQQALIESRTAVDTDLVTLYRTLGGGWSAATLASRS
jgi:NodT family efflux transporter outer membrane factor (OMF) lipoprotein